MHSFHHYILVKAQKLKSQNSYFDELSQQNNDVVLNLRLVD